MAGILIANRWLLFRIACGGIQGCPVQDFRSSTFRASLLGELNGIWAMKTGGLSIVRRIKAAGQLAGKQAQRTNLATMTLPSAYRALGKHVFKAGAFKEEFIANYVQLDNLNAELKAIVSQADDRPAADGLAAKAKGAALAAKAMAQSKVVEHRGKQALAILGEAVFQKHGEQSGPAEVVRPIMDTRMQIIALDEEIVSLADSGSGQFFTPKRIAFAGVVLVVLFGLAIIGNLGKSSADPKDVALNPQNYSGQTLISNMRMGGFGGGGIGFNDPTTNTYVFTLKFPDHDMTQKLIKIGQLNGDLGSMLVTYKVDPNVAKGASCIGTVVDAELAK